jgi:hypothetical protein
VPYPLSGTVEVNCTDQWSLQQFFLENRYIGSIAVEEKNVDFEYYRWTPDVFI